MRSQLTTYHGRRGCPDLWALNLVCCFYSKKGLKKFLGVALRIESAGMRVLREPKPSRARSVAHTESRIARARRAARHTPINSLFRLRHWDAYAPVARALGI